MPDGDRHAADHGRDPSAGKLHPVESKYMAIAAVVGFLLALLLTHGSLIAAFGALALIAGIGWVAQRFMRQSPD
jgi:hypothetical protein